MWSKWPRATTAPTPTIGSRECCRLVFLFFFLVLTSFSDFDSLFGDQSRCVNGRNRANRNILDQQLAPGNYTLRVYEARPQHKLLSKCSVFDFMMNITYVDDDETVFNCEGAGETEESRMTIDDFFFFCLQNCRPTLIRPVILVKDRITTCICLTRMLRSVFFFKKKPTILAFWCPPIARLTLNCKPSRCCAWFTRLAR